MALWLEYLDEMLIVRGLGRDQKVGEKANIEMCSSTYWIE
jgi:hypothetical protein